MTDAQTVQELVDMGLAFYVYEPCAPDDADPVGWRLTDKGVEMSQEMFPDDPLHESYYKWKLA